jgi:UDP-glucose 4-epimerase
MAILVTGGAGFIGSHTVVELLSAHEEVIIVDNFSNAKPQVLKRIEQITGATFKFYQADVTHFDQMKTIFLENSIEAIIHFAGFKAVGESVSEPLKYYENNIQSTLVVLKLMKLFNVANIVFSSSATVYGLSDRVPFFETHPTGGTTNPYGTTKWMIEKILIDFAQVHPEKNVAILRYFNPIGAHASGLIGEDPQGVPNNLMPFMTQVAIGQREKLTVFGSDYPTIDGTGVRDYIHVVDLALGHLAALRKLRTHPGLVIYNLGTGQGTSVLQLIKAFQIATGIVIPYVTAARRSGDIASSYANCDLAKKEMKWEAKQTIQTCCEDAWRWQTLNPKGYDS